MKEREPNQGYFAKLPVDLVYHPIFKRDYSAVHIYIYCLAKSWSKGVFTTGRDELGYETGMVPITAYKALKRLEKHGFVNIKSNNRFSTISICNYSSIEADSNSQSNIQVTTEEQQSNNQVTHLENKNKKENKKITNSKELVPVEESPGYAKWNDEFHAKLGFRITKKPKENENALKAIIKENSAEMMHSVLDYIGWLKATKKGKARPYWFQFISSFIKIREQWDNVQAAMTDDAFQEKNSQDYLSDFFNR